MRSFGIFEAAVTASQMPEKRAENRKLNASKHATPGNAATLLDHRIRFDEAGRRFNAAVVI